MRVFRIQCDPVHNCSNLDGQFLAYEVQCSAERMNVGRTLWSKKNSTIVCGRGDLKRCFGGGKAYGERSFRLILVSPV